MMTKFLPKGQVWKRVRKITCFGLKLGQDLEKRAAHSHQEFPEVPPSPGGRIGRYKLDSCINNCRKSELEFRECFSTRIFYTTSPRLICIELWAIAIQKIKNVVRIKENSLFLFCVCCAFLAFLAIWKRFQAPQRKKRDRLKLIGIAFNINKTLRLAKEFCCFVTTVKPLLSGPPLKRTLSRVSKF